MRSEPRDRPVAIRARERAEIAFSRAAGAPLIGHNQVRLLRDAAQNYPAWLEAIRNARRYVLFENYMIFDDEVGQMFADALIERASAGIKVKVVHDWLGCFGKSSGAFWERLRGGGVEVRVYNPLRFASPLGWLSRDHRKVVAVDGEVGFVTGLCVGKKWAGDAEKNIEPWRDTGVEVRGPAVSEIERGFANIWSMMGEPLPPDFFVDDSAAPPAGEVSVRIVASEPATSGTFRLDQLVVAFARKRVWLTDAYYVGTPTYVQALITAARDGVDVRLLLPNATDLPLLQPLSRAGYGTLLKAGIRIFEWNGIMLHAKTAVIDGRWSRVGSTNLNMASWLGNCEMDAVIEDEGFASQMEEMYLADLNNATEVVLNQKQRVFAPKRAPLHRLPKKGRGSASRAAAGAVRIGNVLGAAITNRRVIDSVESRTTVLWGLSLLSLAVLLAFYPQVLAYPTAFIAAWFALALLYRGAKARRSRSAENTNPRLR